MPDGHSVMPLLKLEDCDWLIAFLIVIIILPIPIILNIQPNNPNNSTFRMFSYIISVKKCIIADKMISWNVNLTKELSNNVVDARKWTHKYTEQNCDHHLVHFCICYDGQLRKKIVFCAGGVIRNVNYEEGTKEWGSYWKIISWIHWSEIQCHLGQLRQYAHKYSGHYYLSINTPIIFEVKEEKCSQSYWMKKSR